MKNRFLLIALMTSIVALGSGCTSPVVGTSTAVWSEGELRSEETVGFDPAWFAAQAALKDMGFAITHYQKNEVEAKVIARAAGDKKIEVKLEKVFGTMTRIHIRVDTFGDKLLSQQIFEEIKRRF